MCSDGTEESEPGARAPSAETCAQRCCLSGLGREPFALLLDWEKGGLGFCFVFLFCFLDLLRVGLDFVLGAVVALFKVFQELVLRFQPRRIPGTPLPPPLTYLCKRSSLRHGAGVGSFLSPCVGVEPGRRVWGVHPPWGVGRRVA